MEKGNEIATGGAGSEPTTVGTGTSIVDPGATGGGGSVAPLVCQVCGMDLETDEDGNCVICGMGPGSSSRPVYESTDGPGLCNICGSPMSGPGVCGSCGMESTPQKAKGLATSSRQNPDGTTTEFRKTPGENTREWTYNADGSITEVEIEPDGTRGEPQTYGPTTPRSES